MDKKKDIKFLVCQIAVAVIGLLFMVFNGSTKLVWWYILMMAMVIPMTYFNYSLCKFENRMHSRWNERYPCNSEPSELRLRISKIGEWILFIFALSLTFLPSA